MKAIEGIIVSVGMNKTVVVEVTRKTPHPLYRKLIKRSKKYKVDDNGMELEVGNKVRIVETKPISKYKFHKVSEVIGANKVKGVKKEASEEIKVEEAKVEEVKEEKKPKAKVVKKTTKKESK